MNLLRISDPRVVQMPTIDCGERLIPIYGLHTRLVIDDSAENTAFLDYRPTFFVRETVGAKLVQATQNLPSNCSLLIKESLRPESVQELWFRTQLQTTSAENPDLSEDQAVALTSQYVAPPWVAGHTGGGAIDVTLCDPHGRELDMGCAYDEDEKTSKGACFSHFDGLEPAALEHRRALFTALEGVGFVNYPFEWWHWSYCDRYWAVVTQQPYALYGPAHSQLATSV